ncbi:hypothetical protein BDV24DRAFT_125652 [Aspergillus arachidicola]|uniref:Uncharacterized protein n=1 Tax=Aspergillus arachidicola TaxID=656916 RepID=A0A5N6YID1_9EURO|nr:hypothetical protein BDV24DRAFT_125652 [Aspergillus arachidicola]
MLLKVICINDTLVRGRKQKAGISIWSWCVYLVVWAADAILNEAGVRLGNIYK